MSNIIMIISYRGGTKAGNGVKLVEIILLHYKTNIINRNAFSHNKYSSIERLQNLKRLSNATLQPRGNRDINVKFKELWSLSFYYFLS